MKNFYFFLIAALFSASSFGQGLGVNSTGAAPHTSAMLHVEVGTSTTKGLLVTGTDNSISTVPDLGTGSRLMFYPGKAAFRAGHVDGNQWNNANVGMYSTATGYNTYATGTYSTAMGYSTFAGGFGSTAVGYSTQATGNFSTAIGRFTTASGVLSTAMGFNVSTNNKQGAFVIGDSDPNGQGMAMPGLPDLFVARFNEGYYLYTSGVTANIGVAINHNGNAWVSACDKNRKENFEQLNGEEVLQKISTINFTSWNYKMQDAKKYRHYGIMAQDFYNAFGKDKYGTIGNDTTVNPIDMIGIDMAAIQALEKRTQIFKEENEKLKSEVSDLKARLEKLEMLLVK